MSQPFKLKDFGNDRTFATVSDLQLTLSSEYRGKHVSIAYKTKPHGLLKAVFVSVDDAGAIHYSYGSAGKVDFDHIEQTALI